jgi:hypothetical protein
LGLDGFRWLQELFRRRDLAGSTDSLVLLELLLLFDELGLQVNGLKGGSG